MNRLRLDFSIDSAQQRAEFLNKYIQTLNFEPNSDELEMMGNYLLWGRNSDGLNSVQSKDVFIPTKSGTWDRDEPESLETLMEDPNFSEVRFRSMATAVIRKSSQKFSREEALANAPEPLKQTFRELFRSIDTTELLCNYWEIAHGKREKPPRDQLLGKFDEKELEELRAQASSLTQPSYWKKRHLLVELRRQQYTLRDSYAPTSYIGTPTTDTDPAEPPSPPCFGVDIDVRPLGVYTPELFKDEEWYATAALSLEEDELNRISHLYWKTKEKPVSSNARAIDFRNPDHLSEIIAALPDLSLQIAQQEENWEETQKFLDAFNYYIELAHLDGIHTDILQQKIAQKRNQDIAAFVNEKYGKSYNMNYISTIFRQRILPDIAKAAEYHMRLLEEMAYPENWKKCSCCGRLLLRDTDHFVRKSNSKDGFTGRCKACDKKARIGRYVYVGE